MAVEREKMEFGRTTSCFGDEQESALDALLRGDHQFLSDLLNNGGVDLDKNYPDKKKKDLLTIGVEEGDKESVRLLLASGAKVNAVNPLLKSVPLHGAIRKSFPDILRILLLNGADPNARTADGKTPLHLSLKSLTKEDENSGGTTCLEVLLKEGGSRLKIDATDNLGRTSLVEFVSSLNANPTQRDVKIVALLLEAGANPKAKLRNETQTVGEVINSFGDSELNRLIRLNLFEPRTLNSTNFQDGVLKEIFDALNEADLSRESCRSRIFLKFKAELGYLKDESISCPPPPGVLTPLQRACELGLQEFAKALLERGMDPNVYGAGTTPAIILGAKNARFEVLRVLAADKRTDFGVNHEGETILHGILRKPYCGALSETLDYEKAWCTLTELREEFFAINHDLRSIINHKDELQNTALHYATQFWPQSVVRSLLELGCNIGMKNVYGEIPVDRILPETLKDFFNSYCLEHDGNVANEDFCITVKYDFLAPDMPNKSKETELQPETEVLWHMSRNVEHRKLLKHPVITSFLWMKWQRISNRYNKNLLFYFLFVFCLTWFIFAQFSGRNLKSNGIIKESCHRMNHTSGLVLLSTDRPIMPLDVKILWFVNTILLAILIFREILQFGIAPRRYIFSPENWLEIAVIALTITLLGAGGYGCNVSLKRQAGAIVIVLSWSELITMIGRHPKLSTYNIYVIMFYRVLWTFVVFLIWYSMFIVAFGMGFYILLHEDDGSSDLEKKEYPYFDYLGLCLVKTFTMFVGELEFSDLPITTPVGYLFLLSFVFLIVVVMMNLLNGLAVSDTGVIREDAEIHSIISQVNVISYLEAMLLGDPFNFLSNWPTFVWLRDFPDCNLGSRIYRIPALRTLFQAIAGGSDILLFYDRLPDKKVSFYPNRDDYRCYYCCSCSSSSNHSEVRFHTSIASSAKFVIADKIKAEHNVESRIESLEKAIRSIAENQTTVSKKLDKLLEIRDF